MYGKTIVSCVLMGFCFGLNSFSQEPEQAQTTPVVTYGDKGFYLRSHNGNYMMHIEWRGQFRLAYPYDDDPVTFDNFGDEQLFLGINRARMKVGGHVFDPTFKYYLEYELFASRLLDFRVMFDKIPWLNVKIGQWKIHYNRERVISSGKQQTGERSILNRAFTIDRQQGVSAYGNLAGDGALNFNYWLTLTMGTGRGSSSNDDTHPMWMSRLQWNFMGKPLDFTGSDLKNTRRLVGIIAVAGVTNRSPYTRFSTSGGGHLEGFEEMEPGQYRVNQLLQESAGMYRGFSWQQELHWKEINDLKNKRITHLAGNLIQGGYFFSNLLQFVPEELEVFARHAFYWPDLSDRDILRDEITLGVNWFFRGHRNKLTLEMSYLDFEYLEVALGPDQVTEIEGRGLRGRLQWEVSF